MDQRFIVRNTINSNKMISFFLLSERMKWIEWRIGHQHLMRFNIMWIVNQTKLDRTKMNNVRSVHFCAYLCIVLFFGSKKPKRKRKNDYMWNVRVRTDQWPMRKLVCIKTKHENPLNSIQKIKNHHLCSSGSGLQLTKPLWNHNSHKVEHVKWTFIPRNKKQTQCIPVNQITKMDLFAK